MKPIGEVTVYWGSMFSGKTTKLIVDLVMAEEGAICFKPATDNRDGEVIRTHDGIEFPVTTVESASEILFLLDSEITTIGIEEASLFLDDPTLLPTIELLRTLGYRVIITGLDLTAEGRPFGQMPEVAAIADNCHKFRTDCVDCGEKASISHFKGTKTEVVKVGGAKEYEPLCRNCWVKKQSWGA
jgi:thymidine kinase